MHSNHPFLNPAHDTIPTDSVICRWNSRALRAIHRKATSLAKLQRNAHLGLAFPMALAGCPDWALCAGLGLVFVQEVSLRY